MKLTLFCLLVACGDSARPNFAVDMMHMINPSIECEPMSTGWGFIPDTAMCSVPQGIVKCTNGPTVNGECHLIWKPEKQGDKK